MFSLVVVIGLTFFPQTDEETRLQRLHTQAINASSLKDYESAKLAYEEILKLVPTKTDWATYVDIHLKLADAHFHLKQYSQAKSLLSDLLKKKPPAQFLNAIEVYLARLDLNLGNAPFAYLTLKKVCQRWPLEKWKGEDRSFYHAVEIYLTDQFTELKKKAKRYTLAKNYKESISFYQEILKAIEEGYYPNVTKESLLYKKVRYLLAEALFLEGSFEKTLLSLDISEKSGSDEIYLAARCYKEKKEYAKALTLFKKCLDSSDLKHYLEAYFELGLGFYNNKNYDEAQKYFASILESKKEERIQKMAALYMAKIHLKKENPKQCEAILSDLSSRLEHSDPLLYEIAYLRGLAAFMVAEYAEAIDCFEIALSTSEFHEWSKAALFKLAESFSYLAADPLKSKQGRLDFFEKGLKIYQNLSKITKHESISLATASLLISQNRVLNDPSSLEKAKNTLLNAHEDFSDEAKIQSLLMLAEIESDYKEKKRFLQEASSSKFEKTALYPQSLYLLGLFELNNGSFEEASLALSKAFSLYEKNDPLKAKESLQAVAKANFFRKAPLLALEAIEKVLIQFDLALSEKEELLYLQGLFASKIEGFEQKTVSSLKEVIFLYPEGKYAPSALYVLGCFYFNQKNYEKALEIFLEVEKNYQNSSLAGNALFWASEILEKLNKSKEEILNLRKRCVEKYRTSPMSPYAYLKHYSFEEYQSGTFEALLHLKDFEELFPESELLTISNYFLGQNESDLLQAISFYKKAYVTFDENQKSLSLLYFRYKAMIEAAMLMISSNEFDSASTVLEKIIAEFKEDNQKCLPFKEKSPYPCLLEESHFTMCQLLIKQNEEKKAKALLLEMLENYKKAGINQGYFLSHVWQELGKLSMNKKEFQTAYECLEEAYECGEKHLYPDQRLNLWILQSECLRAQSKNEMALKLLSKVINEDVVSPIRLKAMFLRAEIYEKDEKHEWAIRQLESLAKKGGPWGEKAEEKLRIRYGVR